MFGNIPHLPFLSPSIQYASTSRMIRTMSPRFRGSSLKDNRCLLFRTIDNSLEIMVSILKSLSANPNAPGTSWFKFINSGRCNHCLWCIILFWSVMRKVIKKTIQTIHVVLKGWSSRWSGNIHFVKSLLLFSVKTIVTHWKIRLKEKGYKIFETLEVFFDLN